MPRSGNLTASLTIALLCLVWSSTWYAIRICLEEQPPLTSAAARFLVAGLAMTALAPRLRRKENVPPPPTWLWIVAATCSFSGSYGILYVAEQHVPSGIAAVLWGIFPLLMAASGVLFLGERLGARQVIGMFVAFAGIVTVFGGGLGGIDAGNVSSAVLLLGSPVVSAVGTTLIKRHGSGTSSVVLNRNGMLLGAGLLGVAAMLCERPGDAVWTLRGVLALGYLALVGTALSFGLYFWLLRTTPASRLALITYVTPVLAMLLGAAVGDGSMGLAAWVGTALVTAGIVLVVTRRKAVPAR